MDAPHDVVHRVAGYAPGRGHGAVEGVKVAASEGGKQLWSEPHGAVEIMVPQYHGHYHGL